MTARGASDLAGQQIRRLRRNKGWTAKDLAGRCAQVGVTHLTPTVITNLETRRKDRQFTVEEWLTLGWVLAVPPLPLLIPAAGEALQVVPGVEMEAAKALEWLQGASCGNCHGKPAAGFTCNTCGRQGT